MPMTFDPDAIEKHGWRQGAVLGPGLLRAARACAPTGIIVNDNDWLIVTSHDCDVVNGRLEKEPTVELLRAERMSRKAPDKQQVWGRNPRAMQFPVADGDGGVAILSVRVHERWQLPRELLSSEPPTHLLENKERRLVAEWLAKRYIRAAFPTAFDGRWRAKMRDWTSLLETHSRWIQGVYLRLNTLSELADGSPYKVHLIVAAPVEAKQDASWPGKRAELEAAVESFWRQFGPGIDFVGVDVHGTDDVTLADIERYQRFDADWVSFTDDSAAPLPAADMTL